MLKDLRFLLCGALLTMVIGTGTAFAANSTFYTDNQAIGLSPYTWKLTGTGADARAEATMPGAYFKTTIKGTSNIGIVIDGTANTGCQAASMPVIEWSVDDGEYKHLQLTQTDTVYTLPIAEKLDPAIPHKVDVYFRAADLAAERWYKPLGHLRIAGVSADEGANIVARPKRSKLAIGYGDSITEGVGVDALFTSWQILEPNNARATWFPVVCSALDCEYGQFGSGGQGLVNPRMAVPPLPKTWDHYDADTSRLKDGKLIPEPDYVFCNMGTNDFVPTSTGTNDYATCPITDAYETWAKAVRAACPHALIFCVVPPSGVQRECVKAVVDIRNKAGDTKVYLIDIPELNSKITIKGTPSQMCYDGVHPTAYGQGTFGACITAKVQQILNKKK